MSKWNKGLMTAMEEFDEAEQTALTGTSPRLENMLELQNSGRQVDEIKDSIDEAMQGAIDLQNMAEMLNSKNHSEVGIKIAHISVESIYKRLGISQRRLPSLESYKYGISMEGIISSIWEAIKKAISAMFTAIGNFFKWLFGFSNSADKVAANNEKRIENAPLQTPVARVPVTSAAKPTDEPEQNDIKPTATSQPETTITDEEKNDVLGQVREHLEQQDEPTEIIEDVVELVEKSDIREVYSEDKLIYFLNKGEKVVKFNGYLYYARNFMVASDNMQKYLFGNSKDTRIKIRPDGFIEPNVKELFSLIGAAKRSIDEFPNIINLNSFDFYDLDNLNSINSKTKEIKSNIMNLEIFKQSSIFHFGLMRLEFTQNEKYKSIGVGFEQKYDVIDGYLMKPVPLDELKYITGLYEDLTATIASVKEYVKDVDKIEQKLKKITEINLSSYKLNASAQAAGYDTDATVQAIRESFQLITSSFNFLYKDFNVFLVSVMNALNEYIKEVISYHEMNIQT